jgi:hypothetical protein
MGIFKKLVKAGVDTVLLPVAVVADVATLGGINTDRDKSYIKGQLESIKKALEDAYDELDED